jgi:dephospho-CoA kinase
VLLDDGSGQLDRDTLRRIILADDTKRRSLDRITHPYILWQMAWEVVSLAAAGNNFAVLDIPLLFESGGKLLFL